MASQYTSFLCDCYTLGGSTGKVVASHANITRSNPGLRQRDLHALCASGAQGVLPSEGPINWIYRL